MRLKQPNPQVCLVELSHLTRALGQACAALKVNSIVTRFVKAMHSLRLTNPCNRVCPTSHTHDRWAGVERDFPANRNCSSPRSINGSAVVLIVQWAGVGAGSRVFRCCVVLGYVLFCLAGRACRASHVQESQPVWRLGVSREIGARILQWRLSMFCLSACSIS